MHHAHFERRNRLVQQTSAQNEFDFRLAVLMRSIAQLMVRIF